MTFQITSIYAAILALMYLGLTFYVIKGRVAAGQSILHGEDMALATKIRRHGNFAEFVPFALILMALAEASGVNTTAVNVAGIILVLARMAQPFGMDPVETNKPLRFIGGVGTHLSMLICIILIFMAQFAA